MLHDCEHKIRIERDFRNVLAYFATLASVRTVEKEGRQYLIDELERSGARLKAAQDALAAAKQPSACAAVRWTINRRRGWTP